MFDLVFIDADKAGYAATWTPLLDGGLLAPHGLICVDNTLMQGQPWLPDEPHRQRRGHRRVQPGAWPPTRASSRSCSRCATG